MKGVKVMSDSESKEKWSKDNVDYEIKRVNVGYLGGHFCGYATFKTRPTKEEGYVGILTYVPVHGGITYASEGKDKSMTYGFDCMHSGDDKNPNCKNIEWVKAEAERMALAIQVAVNYEERYLLGKTSEEKAEVIQEMHDELATKGIDFVLTDNFGAMIGVMCGSL